MMTKTLSEIADSVGGTVVGDPLRVIRGLSGIKEAQDGDLTFLANAKYAPLLEKTQASAVLTAAGVPTGKLDAIVVENPSLAFSKIAEIFFKAGGPAFSGIHPTAIIGGNVSLGKNVALGPYAVIEDNVVLGDNSVIGALSFIGQATTIGNDCLIYPNVTIRERITLKNRVIVHSGTVIGSDGFGFANVKGVNVKIPQIGTVEVQDDVEIGANVTIDRARFDKTVIGRGTKIDNLVQIAHNVVIGRHCIIVAQTGISGSVEVKDGAILAGQSGIAGHLTIGEGAVVAAQAGVTKSVPAKTLVSGYPAKPHERAKKVNAALQRLPEYVKTIQELKQKIAFLESKIK